MRVLCCGDRNWTDVYTVLETLYEYIQVKGPVTIIHGGASGADFICGNVAKELGFRVEEYPADWNRYGKSAGPKRNQKMLRAKPDHVIAFHDSIETSKGTGHMISITKRAEVSFEVVKSKK